MADPESMLHMDRRKRELTTGWFLKLLPGSDTRSFLFTFPTLKQDTWATLEFNKRGRKSTYFNLIYILFVQKWTLSNLSRRKISVKGIG